MKQENKYTVINKKSLAETINFLTGFRYYIFENNGNKDYSFENTKEFNLALNKILEFREYLREQIKK